MTADDLKTARKALGLSQEDMAEAIGVSRVLLGQMERGQAPIEKRTAVAAGAVLTDRMPIYNERPVTSFEGDVPLAEALILWEADAEPPVRVLRLGMDDRRYSNSQGSCTSPWELMGPAWRLTRLLALFHEIVVADKIDPARAHEAFLCIPEYRRAVCPDTIPERFQELEHDVDRHDPD